MSKKLSGFSDYVTAFFDEWIILHIEALNELNLFRVLGHLNVQNRNFQLQLMVRVSQVQIFKILGESFLENGSYFCTLDIHFMLKNMQNRIKNNNPLKFTSCLSKRLGINFFYPENSLVINSTSQMRYFL